jgi:hypothetical protein
MENQMVTVEAGTHRLCWNEDKFQDYRGKFDHIMGLCRNGNLIFFRDSCLLWEFPIEFIQCFSKVFVLTYLFHGSAMASYLEASRIRFDMFSIRDGEPTPWDTTDETKIKEQLRQLITIYEGSANDIGKKEGKANPLSASWYKRQPDPVLAGIKASTESYFKKVARTGSDLNAWTTFKDYRHKVAGKRYSKGFLPNNLRATNDYRHKVSMAYLCNSFMHPLVRGYFESRAVEVFEDLYSLSEMLQWLWRSRIREYKPVTLYIPSQRMRELLKAWLASNTVADLFRRTAAGEVPQYC